MKYNPDIHHRHSIRLRDYDYSSIGAYFVTICVQGRECLFGSVVDGIMILNGLGKILQDEWLRTAEIRNEITIDEFIVMPNHMHGIIIVNDIVGATRWVAQYAKARQIRPTQRVAPTGPESGSIGAIIGQFKAAVTKRINVIRNNPGCPLWQRNYYERIIRNDEEFSAACRYIVENPLKWAEDSENPDNIP